MSLCGRNRSTAKAVESVHISPISRRIEQLCTSKSTKSGLDSPLSRYDHFYRADSKEDWMEGLGCPVA